MNKKHFIINEAIDFLPQGQIDLIEKERQDFNNSAWDTRKKVSEKVIKEEIPLKAPLGRIIVKVDLEYKNQTAFNGGSIRIERQFNNLNRRETEPVNAIVVDAQNIPQGAGVLIHHNALHDTNKIFDYEDLVDGEISIDIQYFSIKENECFLWRKDSEEWNPCTVFDTALRVFEPYKGMLENIPHKQLKDTLFVTSGKLKGKCVATLKGCDYCIVFNDKDLKEHKIIRFRPFGDKENEREEEAILYLDNITEQVNSGTLFVGIDEKDCKTLKEYYG